jgi:hypothetical protein
MNLEFPRNHSRTLHDHCMSFPRYYPCVSDAGYLCENGETFAKTFCYVL